jgi:hypothetical protein
MALYYIVGNSCNITFSLQLWPVQLVIEVTYIYTYQCFIMWQQQEDIQLHTIVYTIYAYIYSADLYIMFSVIKLHSKYVGQDWLKATRGLIYLM